MAGQRRCFFRCELASGHSRHSGTILARPETSRPITCRSIHLTSQPRAKAQGPRHKAEPFRKNQPASQSFLRLLLVAPIMSAAARPRWLVPIHCLTASDKRRETVEPAKPCRVPSPTLKTLSHPSSLRLPQHPLVPHQKFTS